MKRLSYALLAVSLSIGIAGAVTPEQYEAAKTDWLIEPCEEPATLHVAENGQELFLENGLIGRAFRTAPNFATVDLINKMTGDGVLRGVKPEAVIALDGRPVEIGGLKAQPDYGFLDPDWLDEMATNEEAFQFTGYTQGTPHTRYPWKPTRHSDDAPWPPLGVSLKADFAPPASLLPRYDGLTVSIHYELYQGIPVMAKWLTVENRTADTVRIDSASTEILAINEEQKERFHAESSYAFAGMETNHWGVDADYKSQLDFRYQSPILYSSQMPLGPGVEIAPGETFESYITFVMLHDSDDRDRRGLFRRKLYRTLTPQVTENPIFMHVRSSDSETVRAAIDQCAEVGFEMVILTFWSGFNIESEDPDYIANFKADVEYAHAKGVEIGGYTLMCASRGVSDEYNCIDPATGKPGSKFGQSACTATSWYDGYSQRVFNFVDATGMDIIETDGPYHGDVCASTGHKYHKGLDDSQYWQWKRCVGFYEECLKRGMYINTPDRYYYHGAQKYPMGYRESNWSLPRWRQILLARQNIFDGTYWKPPSMGWMFVPLVEYHGGGAVATLEPLSEHLQEYEWHLAQNFGSGVIACYRGPRLYDTDQTKAVVKKWVDFYKRHRAILTSDIVHVRRPDHKTLDIILHANPQLKEKGLAMVYNPTDRTIEKKIELPLYYTGLKKSAKIREQDGRVKRVKLDSECNATVAVEMGPKSITWFVIE